LIVPFSRSSLNNKAGKLSLESHDKYAKGTRHMVDIHSKTFSENKDKCEEKAPVKKKPLQCSSSLVKSTNSLRNMSRSNSSSASMKEGVKRGARRRV
jgi:hypothetical protein